MKPDPNSTIKTNIWRCESTDTCTEPCKSPAFTLGLDDGRFEAWALAASNWKEGQGGHEKARFRKDLRVDVLDLSGAARLTYIIKDAWVSEY